MRTSLRLALAAAILTSILTGRAGAAGAVTYYLSLGDSAAAGLEPPSYVDTNQGYANQLLRLVRPRLSGLQLVKLGCGGETTETLISGGLPWCTYPSGSQLNEATKFLQTHPGQVAFITLDIGGNDVLINCWDPDTGVVDLACVQAQMPDVQANLAYIIETLQAAAPGVPIAGMSYWDFFLGYWIRGQDGQTLAHADDQAIQAMNAGLVSTYQDQGTLVADVAGPDFFNIGDFTDMVSGRWGQVPVNVANDCSWTWFCAKPPICCDLHPNTQGYGVIADAFEAVLPF